MLMLVMLDEKMWIFFWMFALWLVVHVIYVCDSFKVSFFAMKDIFLTYKLLALIVGYGNLENRKLPSLASNGEIIIENPDNGDIQSIFYPEQ